MPFTVCPFRRFLPLVYCSGVWSLITVLLLSVGPVYGEWVPVEKNNEVAGRMTVYVDPDTILREGNVVTMWQLINYKTMQGGRSPSRFSSTKIQKQFNCAEARTRLLKVTDFWGNMGTGEPTEAYIDKGNWVPVEPDSINQALLKVACGYTG